MSEDKKEAYKITLLCVLLLIFEAYEIASLSAPLPSLQGNGLSLCHVKGT
jgi:hypothetical protein